MVQSAHAKKCASRVGDTIEKDHAPVRSGHGRSNPEHGRDRRVCPMARPRMGRTRPRMARPRVARSRMGMATARMGLAGAWVERPRLGTRGCRRCRWRRHHRGRHPCYASVRICGLPRLRRAALRAELLLGVPTGLGPGGPGRRLYGTADSSVPWLCGAPASRRRATAASATPLRRSPAGRLRWAATVRL